MEISCARVRTIALLAVLVCAVAALPAQGSAAVRVTAENELEYAVTVRINTIRASKALRKLVVRPALKTAATKHVTNMALNGYFSHSWLERHALRNLDRVVLAGFGGNVLVRR